MISSIVKELGKSNQAGIGAKYKYLHIQRSHTGNQVHMRLGLKTVWSRGAGDYPNLALRYSVLGFTMRRDSLESLIRHGAILGAESFGVFSPGSSARHGAFACCQA